MPVESTPLVTNEQAGAVATGAAALINQSADKIKKAKMEGPLTFRTLGFIGGLAMIVSNGVGIVDRFFSFNITGSLLGMYGVLFGVLSESLLLLAGNNEIQQSLYLRFYLPPFSTPKSKKVVCLEMPSIWCLKSGRFNGGVRFYAKFLEYTSGRGFFFFFCGSLQATNFNMLDWAVGGFMMFVGITAMIAGLMAARDMRLFKFSIANEEDLKHKWEKYDSDNSGSLDVKELAAFIRDSGVDMTRNEIASVYMALDKNFDERITYEEFYFWWMGEEQRIGDGSVTV